MAHKQLLPFEVFHYYGGALPVASEQEGALIRPGMKGMLQSKGRNAFFLKAASLSVQEKAVARSFKANGIDVVLAEYGTTGARVAPVCEALQIPLVVYFHGYDAWVKDTLEHYSASYKKLFSYAYKIFAASNSIRAQLETLGCPAEKIVYSACAPVDDFFTIHPLRDQQLVLGIGRFTDKKAPYYTLLAFRKVLEQIPTAKLVLCGDGPLLETCNNLVQYFGMQDNVSLPGKVQLQQAMDYLSHASVFVQHSITAASGDREGTPVAILEACAAAVPVVSTLHSGIPEIIEQGTTGLLVAEHAVDAMAAQIIYLLTNKEKAIAMGNAARLHVQQHFTMQQHTATLAHAIQSACTPSKVKP